MTLHYRTNSMSETSRRDGAFLGWVALTFAVVLCVRSGVEPFQMARSGPPGRAVKMLYSGVVGAAFGAVCGAALCGCLAAGHIRMQRGRGRSPWILGATGVGLALFSFPLNLLALKYVILAYRLTDGKNGTVSNSPAHSGHPGGPGCRLTAARR
jgi:hypothetical protein